MLPLLDHRDNATEARVESTGGQKMKRSFWDRYGPVIVLGGILALLVGLLIYGNATQEIEQGYDRPMGGPRQ
jgi:hypothetical protein